MYCRILFSLIFISRFIDDSHEASTRMVGGNAATYDYGLSHVSLQNSTGHHVCGGAVVSRHHAITAAHCLLGVNPQHVKAVVGTTNLDYGGIEYSVENIILHNDYNATSKTNDIAIIRIKGLFRFGYVQILKASEQELVEGDEVIITGFGAHTVGCFGPRLLNMIKTKRDKTEYSEYSDNLLQPDGESSRIMHKLYLPVFNQETCRYAMRYTKEVISSMFCTFSKKGEGTCNGDSGGPVMKDGQLVGLVSWGIPCAVGFPDVHTRITPYIGWIKKHTSNLNCRYRRKNNLKRRLSKTY